MAIQNFDQLNNMSTTWYSKMEISDKTKKERVDLSMEFLEIFLMYFALLMDEESTKERQIEWLEPRLNAVASNHIGVDDLAYINDWSKTEAEKIVDVSMKHIEPIDIDESTVSFGGVEQDRIYHFKEFDVDVPESKYWTSDIRGLLLGIECSSCVSNFYEMYDHLNRGDNRKVWKSQADNKVRPTHEEVDGVDIPITDLFIVGNSTLLFPGDVSNGAEENEVCNCRCWCEYYKK